MNISIPKVNALSISGALVAIAVGLFSIYKMLNPDQVPEARLEIVDLAVITKSNANTKITVKLLNQGGKVAFLKRAVLHFEDVSLAHDDTKAAAEVESVLYDWLITRSDLKERAAEFDLSRRIDENDVDSLEFVLGFEELRTVLSASATMTLEYNVDQKLKSAPIHISVENTGGRVPIRRLPKSSRALAALLRTESSGHTLRQIIRGLAARNYASAADDVLPLTTHGDPRVRAAACSYLGDVRYAPAAEVLVNAITDDDPDVRHSASRAVVALGPDSVFYLGKLYESADPAKRGNAVALAGDIASPVSEAIVLRAMGDRGVTRVVFGEEILVAAIAIRAAARLKLKRVIPLILQSLDDDNMSVKLAAIAATRDLSIEAAAPKLQLLRNSVNVRVRDAAAAALKPNL